MPRRAPWSRDAIRQIAAAQFGLITTAQLDAIGVPRRTVQWSENQLGGMLTFVLPGVHAFETSRLMTPEQHLVAAQLYAGPGALITGAARLRKRGVKAARHRALGPPDEVHVLVDHRSKRASRDFVRVERTIALPPARPDGLLRLAPLSRAVLDACRGSRDEEAVRALIYEVVQRELVAPESLDLERRVGQKRGSRFARLAIESVFAGARSIPEGDLVGLLERAGLGRLRLNVALSSPEGVFIGRPDAYDPDTGVCLEVDSREHHFAVDSWEATMRRHARMTSFGLLVIHATPNRLWTEGGQVMNEVVRAIGSRAGVPPPRVVIREDA